jgi:PHD/YefM family antitoxin component YafN of YafNO toxin-antitoxin module
VTLDKKHEGDSVTLMTLPTALTIKQLHDETGALVRRAGSSRRPVPITDRGTEVAVIVHRSLLMPLSRKRALLPEYEAMMAEAAVDEVQGALDEIRGDR